MVQLFSLFTITLCTAVLARPLSLSGDNNNSQVDTPNLVADNVPSVVNLIPKLTQPPKTFDDLLKSLLPSFGDPAAPHLPSLEPKPHGPLEVYSVEELKNLTKDGAKKLQLDLIQKQLKKGASFADNVAFFYLLDEAFYAADISLDPDVNYIAFKLDELANFGITEIKLPGSLGGDILEKNGKSNVADKVVPKKEKSIAEHEMDQQLLKRYLIASKLTYLKREKVEI
ncbi:hypothetical protein K501DRAFT_266000 [Backusella circina FSU 941]|nr:hypothetical protein K501DRAFT_266000 [Backusella circina FSU 941]